jgi:hypothetical protein
LKSRGYLIERDISIEKIDVVRCEGSNRGRGRISAKRIVRKKRI